MYPTKRIFMNLLPESISNRLSIFFTIPRFGKYPLCNGKLHRGIVIGSFCFPLCARCTAIISSLVFYYCIVPFQPNIILSLFLIIPTLIDGLLQYGFHIESTNFRRISFGLPSGIGIAGIIILMENGTLWGSLLALLHL